MKHIDGHCAVPAETIYVLDAGPGSCYDSPPATVVAGTKTLPVCTLEAALNLVTPARPLIAVRGEFVFTGFSAVLSRTDTVVVSIIGQKQAVTPTLRPYLTVEKGSAYIRGLKFESDRIALTARGGTVRLDRTSFRNCLTGGILLDGAAFDIRNTTVANNGNADRQAFGIDVSKLPASGPTSLTNVTIVDNTAFNLNCAAPIMGTGVLAPGNNDGKCGFASCVTPGADCGAPMLPP
jgi:hypothetical protein